MSNLRILVNSQEELEEVLSKASKVNFRDVPIKEGVLDEENNVYAFNSVWTLDDLLNKKFPQASENACYIQVGNILWQIAG